MLRVLSLLAAARLALCDVQQQKWGTTAFAPPSAAVTTILPALDASPCANTSYCTVRFTGTVVSASTQLLNFSVLADGGVLLWVDDHLLIDQWDNVAAAVRVLPAELSLPMTAGRPLPIRLDYMHYPGAPSRVQLSWVGNFTPAAAVPPSALASQSSPQELQRVALKDRLVNPPVQWQTYDNPTMTTHVRMPSAFAVGATVVDTQSNDVLGDVIVYRRSNPAITYVGPHSYNGSDYTELRLDAWGGRDCTVVFQTTVVNGGADIFFLAASNGTDCAHMAVLLEPKMLWNRAGAFSAPTPTSITAACPGFPNTTVFAAGGVSPVPFPKGGALSWALPLGGGPVGYSSGAAYPLATMLSAIADAQARLAVIQAAWGPALAPLYLPMASVIAWNTMFTPLEGVVTPVSRGWDFGEGYVLFDWDNYFCAYMASLESSSKDIAYSNLMQTTLMRTTSGFVPNFASGFHASVDRTEPQLGAFVALQIYNKWKEAWVIEVIIDALYSWNTWVFTYRRGEGVLAGSDGRADLIVLGSDPNHSPRGVVGGEDNLQAARYESGLDNSPMYDGSDKCGEGGPVCYNTTTHHMELYDVGMTALFLSDTQALMDLATATGRQDMLPTLAARLARVSAAMNAHMWKNDEGTYSNVLFNGSFYPRFSPTSLFPMISGQASPAQVEALMQQASSPLGFCLNSTYAPDANAEMLVDWYGTRNGASDNAGCASDACTRDVVNSAYNFERVEAVVLGAQAPPAAGQVPLFSWYSKSRRDYALTNTSTAPPDAVGGYELVRQEGWCFAAPPTPTTGYAWPTTQLSLWFSPARKEYQTCGSAHCLADTASYTFMGNLCYAFNGTGPENLPCKFGGNSIVRGDAAFYDNDYWRGRIWGPHVQLIFWALSHANYKDMASVKSARAALVAQGRRLVLQEWDLFRQVTENYNGIVGVGEDVGNADPFYHWGALPGFLSFLESGAY